MNGPPELASPSLILDEAGGAGFFSLMSRRSRLPPCRVQRSCTGPAGGSPAWVSADAPSSRPRFRGEIPGAERGVKSLYGGSEGAGRNIT